MKKAGTIKQRLAPEELIRCDDSTSSFLVLPFAVPLPDSIAQGLDEPTIKNPAIPEKGIVGSITKFGSSAMIWFGWGNVMSNQNTGTSSAGGNTDPEEQAVVGSGEFERRKLETLKIDRSYWYPFSQAFSPATGLSLGPLYVAMPRTQYKGAFHSGNEAPTSKLIGSPKEGEEMLARQMSSRLSHRLGFSILVSCCLANAPSNVGVDENLIQHRAAALAEREIYRILKEKS